jgi:hypothetical protein
MSAPGQGVTPGPGGEQRRTRHVSVAIDSRARDQRRLSDLALVRLANIQVRTNQSSRASRRCGLPLTALLRGMIDQLWSQAVFDELFRLLVV